MAATGSGVGRWTRLFTVAGLAFLALSVAGTLLLAANHSDGAGLALGSTAAIAAGRLLAAGGAAGLAYVVGGVVVTLASR